MRAWKLHSITGLQPFGKELAKLALSSLVMIVPVYFVCKSTINTTPWMLPILIALLYVVHCMAMLLTRSFKKEDVALILSIERKMGIDDKLTKKVLAKLLR